MTLTDDEIKHLEFSLKASIYLAQCVPLTIGIKEKLEKDWLLLEKITGKNRMQIASESK